MHFSGPDRRHERPGAGDIAGRADKVTEHGDIVAFLV